MNLFVEGVKDKRSANNWINQTTQPKWQPNIEIKTTFYERFKISIHNSHVWTKTQHLYSFHRRFSLNSSLNSKHTCTPFQTSNQLFCFRWKKESIPVPANQLDPLWQKLNRIDVLNMKSDQIASTWIVQWWNFAYQWMHQSFNNRWTGLLLYFCIFHCYIFRMGYWLLPL